MLISVSAKKLAWHGNMTKPVVGAREEAKEGARATEREAGTSFTRTRSRRSSEQEQRAQTSRFGIPLAGATTGAAPLGTQSRQAREMTCTFFLVLCCAPL